MTGIPWLTLLTLLPLAGGLLALASGSARRARWIAVCIAVASLALALFLWHRFDPSSAVMQFVEFHPWLPGLNAEYHLGVDGIGLLMLLLSAIVTLMSLAASWKNERHDSLYLALVLFLESGLFGTFTVLNFIHWFFFWELSLIPAFFLVSLYGGPQRARAATQFFVYTMVGSVAMLLAFLALFLATGRFDFIDLAQMALDGRLSASITANLHWFGWSGDQIATLIFCGAFLGFAVKVPIVPFHTWLPSTYAEAPSATTMLLTGAMSKMGVYGFLRIMLPIFPAQMQKALTPLLWLAVASIVLPAFSACVQKDLKRIFGYSSINHLGYCLLGICAAVSISDPASSQEKAAALNGVALQMFNHGLTAAALFWFLSLLEGRSSGLRGLNDFGGLRKPAPVFCGLMGIAIFSSLGLPGLNGFPGEFLIFKGSFPLIAPASSLSVLGLMMTAVFLLTILQKVFFGPVADRWASFPDLSTTERLALVPAFALMLLLGLYPQLILGVVNTTMMRLVSALRLP